MPIVPAAEAGLSVSCPRYAKVPGSKRCQHYADRGACSLPSVFMCVEWLRSNPHLAEPDSPRPDVLLARLTALDAPRDPPRRPEPKAPPAPAYGPPVAADLVSPEAVEGFAERGYAFDLETDYGPVKLVPEILPDHAGLEEPVLTFHDARILTVLVSSFPGARVKSVKKVRVSK